MSFSTDRRWMYEMTINGYHNLKYGENVDKFLDFAYSNHGSVERKLNSSGEIVYQIKCPCTRCKNIHYREREVVENHLLSRGFKPNYYTWDEHGETFINEVGVGQSSQMEDDQTDDDVDDDNDDDDDLCRRMVLDSMHPTGHGEEHVPNKNAKSFYDMLHNAEKPLWDGCSDWSTLQAATSLLNWKSHCNVTVAAFNHILPIFKSMLNKGNNLPGNFYETKNLLHKLRLPSERIDACKNHCMLFYKEDLELSHCRWCGESHYKSGKKKVSNLVLTYMPIGPRLQKLYMSTKTAKEMTWHYDNKTKEKHMAHPRDGKAWKHFDETHPSFAEEIRNVRLGLCTDGFSPTSMTSSPYSSWPVFLSIYNLPPWMSLKDSYVKLCLVIPGRKSPGQNLDVFLRPLIDELIHLYDVGIETYDAFRKQNFTMRAILLWTISDFPAYAMLSGWSTHGNLACPCCLGKTKAFRLKAGGKPSWFDCHRKFLPKEHPFRRDKKGFRAGTNVLSLIVHPQLTGGEILDQLSNIPTVYEGQPYSAKNPKSLGFGDTHNWVKKSIFWELPYWHTLLIRHNLDVMHIEKNVFENLFNTFMDTPKTKDNIKARLDIEEICYRNELHTKKGNNNKVLKPKASYSLTKPQVQKVCEWLKNVKFPDGYASNIGGCVNLKECSFYSFKSHDCHVFIQRLLPIALKGYIPNGIWDTITELCMFFRALCSKVLYTDDLVRLQESIIVTICKLEKIFPPGFFDSMEHLVMHLAYEAILGGPVQYRWMYQYDRKLGILKRTIRNKARVEGSIIESYLVNELSTYCNLYLPPTVPTHLNREPRNFAPEIPCSLTTDSRLSIFKVPSRRLFDKGGKRVNVTANEMHKIHTYILLNCEEVYESICSFESWIKESEPLIEDGQLDIKKENIFANWLEREVTLTPNDRNALLKDLTRGPLSEVRSHKGYLINGYKFHTQTTYDGRVTQNSGVCVKGASYNQTESDYYGILDDILEIEYHSRLGRCVVVVFKCTWFDPVQGVRVDRKHKLVDIKHTKKGCFDDPFILASQAQQVYYLPYPSMKDWWAVVKTSPRGIYEVAEDSSDISVVEDDDNVAGDHFLQENERLDLTSTNEDIEPFPFQQGYVEEVVDDANDDDDQDEDEDEDESD